MDKAIVVFLADGTSRFNGMTANAVKSFLNHTPHVHVGLLALNADAYEYVSEVMGDHRKR
jgi:hypothetical protein